MPEASLPGAVVVFEHEGDTWKIRVRPASFMDRSHYLALLREAEEHLQGLGLVEPWGKIDDPELAALRSLYIMRAEALACVPRQETDRGTIYLAEDAQGEPLELPQAWTDIATIHEAIPWTVLEALVQAARRVNPGVFPTAPFGSGPWRIEPMRS